MTDAFMADAVIRERYRLKEGDTFSSAFSLVSIENILFFIVASAIYVLEVIFDTFKKEVDNRIERSVVASVAWYHAKAMEFQYGDKMVFNDTTKQFVYARKDERKQVVKYAAVKDRGGAVQILVSTQKNGKPAPLETEVLTAFKHYLNSIKIAGVTLSIKSLPADIIKMNVRVQINPQVFTSAGIRLADGRKAVEDAINTYLSDIVYGGTFNKTKLVDAIQAVEGVVDVELGECSARADFEPQLKAITGNNYTSISGCFIAEELEKTIAYVVQL